MTLNSIKLQVLLYPGNSDPQLRELYVSIILPNQSTGKNRWQYKKQDPSCLSNLRAYVTYLANQIGLFSPIDASHPDVWLIFRLIITKLEICSGLSGTSPIFRYLPKYSEQDTNLTNAVG